LEISSAGLSSSEVSQRLAEFGYNEVQEKRESDIIKFARKFWGLTAAMMWALVFITWFMNITHRDYNHKNCKDLSDNGSFSHWDHLPCISS
jgi:hypothetical protein